ncbi:efflux RND transporter permease subunit [Frigidibacter sp. SD6-1]|uniref:efflux RND transporter permease subunit n=1 Tax=Frigidibacter sp. SD6-1 TaxID=3032581 RepID=UPI0024DFB2AF|nr:efflux RND transporter permease subunit [Frigidibacter sp. SD6-1]
MERPVLAFVLNALIVIAGLAALLGIEVRELPSVEAPVITVSTDFPGAAPETVDREVTAVIEGAVSRVSGVNAISSSSRFGASRVSIEFRDKVDIDIAASDVRDALARVTGALPDGAEVPRAIKADANGETVVRLALTSPRRGSEALTALAEDLLEDRLLAIPGVADVQMNGARSAIFRVDVDQAALASRGLTLADLTRVLGSATLDAPAGALTSARQSLFVRATAEIATEADIEDLTVAPDVRLGDVASVYFGPEPGTSVLRTNGETGIGLSVIRAAQSNSLAISAAVTALVAEVQRDLPPDVTLFVSSDAAAFVRGALHEIEVALSLSVMVVALIIFLFLRDLRATLIPVLAIPVSLIGTLAALWAVGFSVNILTLLAFVLATGLVVDDAIVVLENIARRRAEGMGPRAAAVLGTGQVFFAVVATTTTLAAVFVPLSFLPGQVGGLFREFGLTLALSVAISALVALSFCPVLAALTLKGAPAGEVRRPGFLARAYAASLRAALRVPLAIVLAAVLAAITAWFLQSSIRRELTPPEDRSVILLSVRAPQGAALDYTYEKMRQIEDLVEPLRTSGEARSIFSVSGTGSGNGGFIVIALVDWADRARSQQEIAAEAQSRIDGVIGVRATLLQPNSLGIRGAGQGLSFAVVGPDYPALAEAASRLVARMGEDPAFGRTQVGYDLTQAQLFVTVDRARATDLGIDIAGLGPAIEALIDGRKVGQVFLGDKSYDISLTSGSEPVNDPGDLERLFVKAGDGQMVPLSSFVTLEERPVAPDLQREGLMRAVPVSAGLTPDLSLGAALDRVRALAPEVLAEGMRIVPLAEAKLLETSQSGTLITFGFALLVVLLVLAAQFESVVSALIVMATVPLGLACAVFALLLTGGSLNVYSQIGLVLLVGIMAKNGILVVEFANQRREEGASVRTAIEEAALIRLRPVAMTMLSTVVGAVPLLLASGAGAEARAALGWVIVGGLGLSALATLYLTPAAYLLLAGLSKPRSAGRDRLQAELAKAGF